MMLLGILVASIWYVALAWYGIATGLLPATGMNYFQYGLMMLVAQFPLMFLALIPFVATQLATEFMPRTAGILNGVTLGVLAICVMLPIHLFLGPETEASRLFAIDAMAQIGRLTVTWFLSIDLIRLVLIKVSRRVGSPVLCTANLAFVLAAAGILYVGAVFAFDAPVPLPGMSVRPVESVGMVMLLGLLIGLTFSLTFEIPRALLETFTKRKATELSAGAENPVAMVPTWTGRSGQEVKGYSNTVERH